MARKARRAIHSLRALVAAFGITLAGCGALLPGEALAEPPNGCGFPRGIALAFVGHSSLSRLGLSDDHDVEGAFYVTAEPIPPRSGPEPMRAWCVLAGDGHTEGGPVPDNWTPPPHP